MTIKAVRDVALHQTRKGEWELTVGGFYICTINTEGQLELHGSVPDDIGLQVDGSGVIKIKGHTHE